MLYYKYSDYLKNKYGEKVYKLPVNLPVTCPNRLDGDGCAFCAGAGTGFEAMAATVSVTEQLTRTRQMITRKYHANKYIAYFQNYTNTFLPPDRFRSYLMEATRIPGVVEISVSTRPDYQWFLGKIFFKPGNLGYPVFQTKYAKGWSIHLLRSSLP